ncbi:MAG TPA: energy-coupling factor transporter transmembrane component T [Thermomicrobiales bacterium]|nr:energy-coupling factor transporter transmembrane component T [Thermomicrobiales bacterium]
MRSINPSCKLVGLIIVTIALAAARDPLVNAIVFVACLLLLAIARVPFRHVAMRMAPLVLVACGLFMTGYRFGREDVGAIGDPALMNGLILSSRVLAFAGIGFLFALTTDKLDLVHSLQQQFRLPPGYAYALVAAWNLLPDLEREYQRTRFAFEARGLNPRPLSPSLLKPMLVKTVLWSQALAMAMESRGFDGSAPRTEWRVLRIGVQDVVFLAMCVLGWAAVLIPV